MSKAVVVKRLQEVCFMTSPLETLPAVFMGPVTHFGHSQSNIRSVLEILVVPCFTKEDYPRCGW